MVFSDEENLGIIIVNSYRRFQKWSSVMKKTLEVNIVKSYLEPGPILISMHARAHDVL